MCVQSEANVVTNLVVEEKKGIYNYYFTELEALRLVEIQKNIIQI